MTEPIAGQVQRTWDSDLHSLRAHRSAVLHFVLPPLCTLEVANHEIGMAEGRQSSRTRSQPDLQVSVPVREHKHFAPGPAGND